MSLMSLLLIPASQLLGAGCLFLGGKNIIISNSGYFRHSVCIKEFADKKSASLLGRESSCSSEASYRYERGVNEKKLTQI